MGNLRLFNQPRLKGFLRFVRAFGDETTSLRLFRGIKGETNPVITVGRDGRFRLLNSH